MKKQQQQMSVWEKIQETSCHACGKSEKEQNVKNIQK